MEFDLSNSKVCINAPPFSKRSVDPQLVAEELECFQWYVSARGRRKIMMTRRSIDRKICTIARGVENVHVGCPKLKIELVKSVLSHYYPELMFGQ